MNHHSYSSYDSQQEDDQVQPMYLGRVLSQDLHKNTNLIKSKNNNICVPKPSLNNDQLDSNSDDQNQNQLLQPKLKIKNKEQINILNNPSTVTTKSQISKMGRRPLTAAYTFKLPPSQNKRKRHDPVSLFQQTSQAWKKDRFLTNRANNKEGRKLDLSKRNKNYKAIDIA